MTRINAGINPVELCDQHLKAELRELPRIFTHVGRYGVDPGRIPKEFTLGVGHVLFFTDKLEYLYLRWEQLIEEMVYRFSKVTPATLKRFAGRRYMVSQSETWREVKKPKHNWGEDTKARKLLCERINERLQEMKGVPKWTGRPCPAWVKTAKK